MNADKFTKMFKLEIPVWEVNDKLARLFVQIEKYPNLLEIEAKNAAAAIMGTKAHGQGMQDRYQTYSGLTKKINAHMTQGYKVTELASGNGYSTYSIK